MEKLTGYIILGPAYGRDYKSKQSLLKDFFKGKDFTIYTPKGSTYTSIRDVAKGTTIEFRYNKLEEIFMFKIAEQFEDKLVGYLKDGTFICPSCALETKEELTRVYKINIAPYSQHCKECGDKVVNGGFSIDLFE